jgi:hypothetical protein
MNTLTYDTETIIKSIKKLPQESLLELAQFINYLAYKNQQKILTNQQPISLEETEKLTEELLAEIGDELPYLSDYAVSREGIYEEHL